MTSMQQWYVVQTKPHKEQVARDNLQRQGYVAYCPMISQSRHRRARWQRVIEPLFPRYLFVQLTEGEDDFSPIRSTLGVLNLVRFGGVPAVIEQPVIDNIQQQESWLEQNATVRPPWRSGDKVQILHGPFAGLDGVFTKQNKDERIVVLMRILGRDSCISVDKDSLAPGPDARYYRMAKS